MDAGGIDERSLVRYLLGALSEAEQEAVEDRAFVDSRYRGALEGAEADLIDAYVRGELRPPERRAFERRFLSSPRRRARVEFARALAAAAAQTGNEVSATRECRPVWRSPAALVRLWPRALPFAAALATLVCVAGYFFENTAMRHRVAALEAARGVLEKQEEGLRRRLAVEQHRARALAAELSKHQGSGGPPGPVVASLLLPAGLSRAGSAREQLVLGASVQLAHIDVQLQAGDDYSRYRVELRTTDGDEVLTWGQLHKRRTGAGYALSVDVPASALSARTYELAIQGVRDTSGVEELSYSYFSVQRR